MQVTTQFFSLMHVVRHLSRKSLKIIGLLLLANPRMAVSLSFASSKLCTSPRGFISYYPCRKRSTSTQLSLAYSRRKVLIADTLRTRDCSRLLLPERPTIIRAMSTENLSEIGNAAGSEINFNVNVLCLHGKGNNGSSFQKILAPLEKQLQDEASLNFQFDYVDAPFPMEENKHNKMQWWTLPAGVRSFNAAEYNGFEKSSKLVKDALRKKHYHFILGHSQGAILLSALLSSNSWTNIFRDKNQPLPLGYILNGCAWPNPFSNQLESFQYQSSNQNDVEISLSNSVARKPKLLFIIGRQDGINPPEGAELVRDTLINGGMEADTVYHPGGHGVPVKDDIAVKQIIQWISAQATVLTI